jgi:Transposase, Mutator family
MGHPGWEHQPGDPEVAAGLVFPGWLLERRRRAEAALVTVVATSYLLGVSTRWMEKLVETLGITRLSKSQVSEMARDLDAQVEAFRTRPLHAGPYTFAATDGLVLKVGEAGHNLSKGRSAMKRRRPPLEECGSSDRHQRCAQEVLGLGNVAMQSISGAYSPASVNCAAWRAYLLGIPASRTSQTCHPASACTNDLRTLPNSVTYLICHKAERRNRTPLLATCFALCASSTIHLANFCAP